MNEKPHFVDLGIDGNTIVLKWILKKQVCSVVKVTVSIMGLFDVTSN